MFDFDALDAGIESHHIADQRGESIPGDELPSNTHERKQFNQGKESEAKKDFDALDGSTESEHEADEREESMPGDENKPSTTEERKQASESQEPSPRKTDPLKDTDTSREMAEPATIESVQELLDAGEPTRAAEAAARLVKSLSPGISKYRLQKLHLQALLHPKHQMNRGSNPNFNWPLVLAQTLVEEQPNDTQLQAMLGRVLFLNGRKSEAQASWKRAAGHESPGGENQKLIRSLMILEDEKARGNIAFKDGKWEVACQAYTKAIDADAYQVDRETLAAVLGNRSAANRKLAHFEDALADAEESLRLSPSYVKATFRRGLALMELDRYQEALIDLKHVEKVDPKVGGLTEWVLRASHWVRARQKNHYATLGLPMDASQADIVKTYKQLALKWHPDKVASEARKEAEERFKEINTAFEALSDEKQRELYDYGQKKPDLSSPFGKMPKQLQKMGYTTRRGDGLTTCMICGEECKLTSEKQWHVKLMHPGFFDEKGAAAAGYRVR